MANAETTSLKIREQAKQRALKVIEANKDCTSYVRPEDLETQSLFVPVVSVIVPTKDEFHDYISGVGILPKVPLMNLIAEKAGVNIHRTETSKRGEYVWLGHSFGNRRQPDGTMLERDATYEFDAEKRAELDFIADVGKEPKDQKYTTDLAKRKHLLELCKFADQRANTGAQLALIHKLAKIPASFKNAQELARGMIVCRIDRNVDGVLADPNMREAAIGQMLGTRREIFGPPTDEPQQQIAAPTEDEPQEEDDPFATPEPEPQPPQEGDARINLVAQLEEWLTVDSLAQKSRDHIRALLDNDAPDEELKQALDVINKYFATKQGAK